MAGISEAVRGKLANGDRSVFDVSRVVCQAQSEEGPAFDPSGKPITGLHHAKREVVSCQYMGPASNARTPKRREKIPPLEQQKMILAYQWGRSTKYPKSGEPQAESPEVVLTMRTLIEFSGKWYCMEVVDAGADGLLNGPNDAIVVSDYDIEKGGGNWINRNGILYTSDPEAPYGESKKTPPVAVNTPRGPVAVQDTLLVKKTEEAPKGLIDAVQSALLGGLKMVGVQ